MNNFILFTTYMIDEITIPKEDQNFLFSKKRNLISFPFGDNLDEYEDDLTTNDFKKLQIYRIKDTNIFGIFCFSIIFANLNLKIEGVNLLKALYFDILNYLKQVQPDNLPNEKTIHYFYIHDRDLGENKFLKVIEGEQLKEIKQALKIEKLSLTLFQHEDNAINNLLSNFRIEEFNEFKTKHKEFKTELLERFIKKKLKYGVEADLKKMNKNE